MGPITALVLTLSIQVPDSLRRVAEAQPLFASHEPIELLIEGPLAQVFAERSQDPEEFAGTLVARSPDGPRTLALALRTRGLTRLRRDVCEFPPLRLDFDREEVDGSVFAGQNRLKLNVHCDSDRSEYEQYVLQEYLAYRMFNLLSDVSFRVRLAHVSYVDSAQPRDTLVRPAFLIEDQELMAARNGLSVVIAPAVPPAVMDPRHLALVELFEYMVGNPDWSAFGKGPDEEECCHNTQPVGDPARGPVFAVPYDFDVTGLVHTRYADRVFQPSQRDLGIRTVRDRVFRGRCASQPHWPEVFRLFNEKREAFYALYREQEGLAPDVLRSSLEYLDEFYETINDPRGVEREIREPCRG